ncbi:MAG: hypothetical protein QOH50_3661, partial [Kribbellaceae bacterium]|nr:hypothetical protein [Kribbellaceae bacterium]
VLGSNSEPLDVGREERFVTKPIRRALIVRDKGCVICGAPPDQCDVHHVVHWIDGGETAVGNLALVCKPHHRDIDRGDWIIQIINGKVQITRPGWAEPNHPQPAHAQPAHPQPAHPEWSWGGDPAERAREGDPADPDDPARERSGGPGDPPRGESPTADSRSGGSPDDRSRAAGSRAGGSPDDGSRAAESRAGGLPDDGSRAGGSQAGGSQAGGWPQRGRGSGAGERAWPWTGDPDPLTKEPADRLNAWGDDQPTVTPTRHEPATATTTGAWPWGDGDDASPGP